MNTPIQETLFTDPQAQIPAGFCPRCGAELYAPSLTCGRCEEEMP